MATSDWPGLALADWDNSKQTLHRYAQIVGKVRMALTPPQNHWWHVTLLPGTVGLQTGPMPVGDGRTVDLAFDFVGHRLRATSSDGRTDGFALVDGLAVGEFHDAVFSLLQRLDVSVTINPAPYELDGPPLSEDREHRAYDAEAVGRFWIVVHHTAAVLREFAGGFSGKQSPVQLFWHSFDLAYARYSGRVAPIRRDADAVTKQAYSHEVIAFGFWPGDDRTQYPAFYSYTAPAPEGLAEQPLQPDAAWWNADAGTAYLRYDDVRESEKPEHLLRAFFDSAYDAGARTAGWDIDSLTTGAAPRPGST